MVDRTAEEALQDRILRLGDHNGRFVKVLEDDLSALRLLWRKYVALFGTNEERVKLFNSVSGEAAYSIERTMFEASMLAVCRLTDPLSSLTAKEVNLSVRNLPKFLTNGADEELQELIVLAVEKSEFARNWRNKRIAHSDRETRFGNSPLQSASRAKVRSAIDAIADCIKRFAFIEMNVTLVTHPITGLAGDVVEFLEILYLGKLEQSRRRDEVKSLLSQGRYEEIKAFESLPDWLTFRPEDEIDI